MHMLRLLAVAVLLAGFAASGAAQAAQKTVLITGSTDGLGRELAFRIGATGAHVIVHGRNRERGMQVADSIRKLGKGARATFYAADFAKLADVRALADSVLKNHARLDVLINNAGIWLRTATTRQLSADGNELSWQVNYLSGFLLTHLLKPLLVKSAPSRVINVASRAHGPIDLDDVNQERNFSGQRGYTTSKMAQIMFTFDLARELESARVRVYAVHPASQMDTYMVRNAGSMPRSTVDDGAASVMNLVTTESIPTGAYYDMLAPGRAASQAYDEAARARLREISRRQTGLR
jgi:NAD(P)-dependent dehydrogenase (short-subunit alcohol dehydrogenase family)